MSELKRLAEAANTDVAWWPLDELKDTMTVFDKHDAAYIAAASPDAILALIARIDDAEATSAAMSKVFLEDMKTVEAERDRLREALKGFYDNSIKADWPADIYEAARQALGAQS